jgi:hypothetical protein
MLSNVETCISAQYASFSTKRIPDEWVDERQHDEAMHFLRHQKDPCKQLNIEKDPRH